MRFSAALLCLGLAVGCASAPARASEADTAIAAFADVCMRALETQGPIIDDVIKANPLLRASLVKEPTGAGLARGDLLAWTSRSGALRVSLAVSAKCRMIFVSPDAAAARDGILKSASEAKQPFLPLYSGPNATGGATRDIVCRDRDSGKGQALLLTVSAGGGGNKGGQLLLDALELKGSCAEERDRSVIAIPKARGSQ